MPVVDEIDAVLAKLPANGPFNGTAFHSLFRLGMLLSDAEKIKRHGSGLLNPETVNTDIDIETEDESPVAIPEPQEQQTQEELIQSEPELAVEVEDDIPGFDDFLAKFNLSTQNQESSELAFPVEIDETIDSISGDIGVNAENDVFDFIPPANVDVHMNNVDLDIYEVVGVTGFMDSICETVNIASQPVATDIDRSIEETAGTETDFWF